MKAEPYAVIISAASDYNRGDQALLWQAKQVLDDSLNIRKFYVFNVDNESLEQSIKEGFETLEPILHHPSSRIKAKNNLRYGPELLIRWGSIAFIDLIKCSLLLLDKFNYMKFLLTPEQKHTLEILAGADIVAVKGGGFIHSYGAITDPYYIYYSLFHIRLSKKLGRRVVILPNSFGPFCGLGVKQQVKTALNKCNIIATRESLSTRSLTEIGLSDVVQYPDMAFVLEKEENELVKQLTKGYSLDKLNKKIAITVRPYRFPELKNSEEAYTNYVETMAKFADWLLENGYSVFFVVQTYSENNSHENDLECVKLVMKQMRREAVCIHNKDLNCKSIKSLYSKFDMIIGTRFHSVIFSIAEGVPAIALSYSGNKTTGIMSDIGLEEYAIKASDVTFDMLMEKFVQLSKYEDEYKRKAYEYTQSAHEKYAELVEYIRGSK